MVAPYMKRTTVMLPLELKARAENKARERGLSFGEVVRESLSRYVRDEGAGRGGDSLLADDAVFGGPTPPDLAAEHDRHLYDDPER